MNTSSSDDMPLGCAVVIIGVVFVVIIVGIISQFHTATHKDCHVIDKDRASNHNGGSSMRVYTDNCGTFKVADSWLSWTFNSADRYAGIRRGGTYDFKTRGWRIPFFSSFPNIVEVEKAS